MSASYWSPASKRGRATAHDDECMNGVQILLDHLMWDLRHFRSIRDVSVCTSLNCQLWLRFSEVITIQEFPCLRILPSALCTVVAKWGNPPPSVCDFHCDLRLLRQYKGRDEPPFCVSHSPSRYQANQPAPKR